MSLAALLLAGLGAVIAFSATTVESDAGFRVLYGTDASGDHLLAIDPATAISTEIGGMEVGSVPSPAIDPVKGTMYAGGGGGISFVFTVDPATGPATLVGHTGL